MIDPVNDVEPAGMPALWFRNDDMAMDGAGEPAD
jgi:hypothetical protein